MGRKRHKRQRARQTSREAHEGRIYLCELCLKTFDTGTRLREHKASHTNKPFQELSNRTMKNTPHLFLEARLKLEQLKSFQLLRSMLQNGLKSKLLTSLDNKWMRHFIRRSQKKEDFPKKENVDTVMANESLNYKEDKKKNYKFKCAECGKKFLSKAALKIHLNSHFGIKAFKCPKCGLRLSQKGGLTVHMRIHTGEKPFKCKVCSKAFTQPVSRDHMSTHTGERLYKCDICLAAYGSSAVLKTHKISKHSLLRPYQCDICKKDFCDKDYLTKHRTVHRDVRPYPCTKCSKSFITKSNLRRHLIIHTGQRPFVCTICQKPYNNTSSLMYHMKTHTGDRKYICGICDQELASKQNLERHMNLHTRLKA